MFGHSDNRSSDRNTASSDGMLSSEEATKAAAALVGDMTTKYPPTDLPSPTSAPATPPEPVPPAVTTFEPSAPATPAPSLVLSTPAASAGNASPAVPNELLDIKQQALQHLSPLVDHLEQSASDRFRTTMMMIQASDNSTLIKAAYDAALQITDDKERAQALLDLVNEINYFTQKNATTES